MVRYSNWPLADRAQDGSMGLIKVLQRTFATYGIPDELPTVEALDLLLISQGHSYLTGVFTIGLALWPFLIAIGEQ